MALWTDSQIATAVLILESSPRGMRVDALRERIAEVLGRPITSSNLCHAFKQRGMRSPQWYIGAKSHPTVAKAPAMPPPRPVRKTSPVRPEQTQEFDIPVHFEDPDEDTRRHGRGNSSVPPPIDRRRTDPSPSPFERQPVESEPPPPPPDPVQQERARQADRVERNRNNDLVGRLRDAQDRQAVWDVIATAQEPPRIVRLERNSGLRDVCALALASDWHVEEPVDPVSVAGRNEYNLEIAEKRVDRYFQGIVWHIQHHRASKWLSIRHLLLWLGGDLYTGYIHPELIENNELSPTEAVRWLLPRVEGGIRTVLRELQLEQISIVCSFGNHGRTTDKMRVATSASNSFDLLLYLGLQDRLKDEVDRITFHIDKSDHQYAEVYDWKLHFHHGHDVRYQGGIGGLGIPLLKAVAAWDELRHSDYHMIGHWHSWRDFGRAVVNGSLIGHSPYAMKIRASYEPPAQYFALIDAKEGKCMPNKLWVRDSSETCK